MPILLILGGIAIDHLCRVKDAKAAYSQALDYSENLGGMAYNTAVAAAQLGIKTTLLSPIGDDFPGAPSLRNLTYKFQKKQGKTTRCTLIYDGKAERIYFLRGAYHDIDVKKAKAAIKKADWVHFAGFVPCFSELAKYAKAQKKTISCNPGYDLFHYPPKDRLIRAMIACSDYAVMSINEFMYGVKEKGRIGKALRAEFSDKILAITYGKKGSVIMEEGGKYATVIPTYKVAAKSPFGAGDAYTGAFISALMNGSCIHNAAYLASAAGSFAVEEKKTTPKLSWAKLNRRANELLRGENAMELGFPFKLKARKRK